MRLRQKPLMGHYVMGAEGKAWLEPMDSHSSYWQLNGLEIRCRRIKGKQSFETQNAEYLLSARR